MGVSPGVAGVYPLSQAGPAWSSSLLLSGMSEVTTAPPAPCCLQGSKMGPGSFAPCVTRSPSPAAGGFAFMCPEHRDPSCSLCVQGPGVRERPPCGWEAGAVCPVV